MARTIDYGNLMHRAMRSLIQSVLEDVGKNGLPGAHHFFITFDTTHPEVQEHLRSVFARVVDWGFRYLKLDFLYAGALQGVRHNDLPREQVAGFTTFVD